MKLVEVHFHNFRSASDALTVCSLSVDSAITCLLGASESGKSNLLQAMAKFESGEFDFEDVPRIQVTGNQVSIPNDLPMVSAIYTLDENDDPRLRNLLDESKDRITLSRNYKGPIFSGELPERSYEDIRQDIASLEASVTEAVTRFLRGYSRQRKNLQLSSVPSSRSTSVWFNRFFDLLRDGLFDSAANASEALQIFDRFKTSLSQLNSDAVERVPERTSRPAFRAVQSVDDLLEEMLSATEGGVGELLATRPKFRLISSDPSEWLQGEYTLEELVTGNTTSASLLLEIAGLDFEALETVPDYMVPDLLDQASATASARLNQYWSQEEIKIWFQLSSRTGNLIIYVVTDDHRGLPTQRNLGFRWYLEFLLTYAHARESGEPTVLLFDEPGIHLHPKAQEDLKRLLKQDISRDMQVIFTTHLPGMIDTTRLDGIRGVLKNEVNRPGSWVINEEYSPEHNQITWDVMLRAIGVETIAGYYPGRVVVVEGLSDRQFLISIARLLAKEGFPSALHLEMGLVRLYPGHGTKSMSVICPRLISNEATFAVLLDSDQAGDSAKQSLDSKYSPPNQWFRAIIQVTDPEFEDSYFSDSEEHELEDLFGVEVYSSMVNQTFAAHTQQVGHFEPAPDSPPSMLKRQAQSWLERTGKSPELIYQVANQFDTMLQGGVVVLSTDVKNRFVTLLKKITEETELQ